MPVSAHHDKVFTTSLRFPDQCRRDIAIAAVDIVDSRGQAVVLKKMRHVGARLSVHIGKPIPIDDYDPYVPRAP